MTEPSGESPHNDYAPTSAFVLDKQAGEALALELEKETIRNNNQEHHSHGKRKLNHGEEFSFKPLVWHLL